MGLLRSLFGGDLEAKLDRVERLCEEGNPVIALEQAEKLARKADGALAERAQKLVDRARQAALESVMVKAKAAEAEGDFEDAADWLDAAAEHQQNPVARAELEAKRDALRQQAEEQEMQDRLTAAAASHVDEEGELVGLDIPLEDRYAIHLDTLAPSYREQYAERPRDFRQAVVDLNEGDAAAAIAGLEPLLAAAPDEPLLRLEAGRARLFAGDATAAADDLLAAWKALGDEPLDAASISSPATLWGEAALLSGQADEVVRRLEATAEPSALGLPAIGKLYAEGLITAGNLAEAQSYLEDAAAMMPGEPDFSVLLAYALNERGDSGRALEVLESSFARSCGKGCSAKSLHLPTVQALAALYIATGRNPERARELQTIVATQTGGLVS